MNRYVPSTTISQEGDKERHPLLSETDINNILVNGAMISLAKLKRAQHFNARIYYYAEIGVYLEVSLSRGAGIADTTVEAVERIHQEATRIHMDASKATRKQGEPSVI